MVNFSLLRLAVRTVAYSFLLPRPAYAKASAGWRDAHMSAEDLACLREAGASLRRRQGEGGAGRACPALNAGCPVRFLCPRRSWVLRAYAGRTIFGVLRLCGFRVSRGINPRRRGSWGIRG